MAVVEITMGGIITGISAVGIIACLTGLAVAGKIFARQRKRLLEKIETE